MQDKANLGGELVTLHERLRDKQRHTDQLSQQLQELERSQREHVAWAADAIAIGEAHAADSEALHHQAKAEAQRCAAFRHPLTPQPQL